MLIMRPDENNWLKRLLCSQNECGMALPILFVVRTICWKRVEDTPELMLCICGHLGRELHNSPFTYPLL